MSPESEKIRDQFADQLSSFDDRLEATSTDVDMLADIQAGIGSLLASGGGSEAAIRGVLQERYEAGELRKETFQLVKSMLDRYVTEKVPTSPVPAEPVESMAAPEPESDDDFGTTTVIPKDALPFNKTATRVQVGSVLRDRFLLQEEVSGGSMGTVYKALDRRLAEAGSEQHSVAIKVLSPALAEDGHALRALQQEAAKTRCLLHPNIVRFIDLDRDDDLYFLILEWLEGRTLAEILDSTDARSIDVEAAFRIVRQVGDALDYAHRCGIVHADIKPGNIMVMPNGDAKLFDFGVARVRQQQVGTDFDPGVLGALTPAYSSMQVLGGEEPVASDDVFSLACLLYRLVAGYRVFGPRNAAEASQTGMTPQKPQGINDEQWRVLKKALSYPRVTRFESVKAFTDALDECAEDTATTVSFEAPERFGTDDDGGSPGKWLAIMVVLLGLGGIGAQQMGYLDPWLEQLQGSSEIVDVAGPNPDEELIIEEVAAEPELEIAPTIIDEPAAEAAIEPADEDVAEVTTEVVEEPVPVEPELNLVDFSKLPPPTTIVRFSLDGRVAETTQVELIEDGDPVLVDFIREGDVSATLTLRLEEVGFSGNRSPWGSGQYAFSNGGLVVFPRGQERARVTLTTASDPRREPDQQSTLRLRFTDAAESELAVVNVVLRDDDQRAYENRLPDNTIAFASSQVSVSEADPAVQIDVIRFNPDNTSVEVGYSVEDISATEGEDYFAPGTYSISFGPGQRSARLLIPLVQDSVAEGDEAFVVKLAVDLESRPANISPNIAVMIRDDER
ncbi:MAG: protein kinase [Gammaproteobacteria bacterium]|jgi:serine/threonine protein kinase|nr:protein kinase [Gammaproteobacteria bacterium]MDH3810425.1 protein kinase [Gammaproteobacteria bacterium]